MAGTLQVLLLEDIDTLGRAGDIVTVAEGYARNSLFPAGRAALATKQVQEVKSAKDAAKQRKAEEELQGFQNIADRMEHTELVIPMKTKDGSDIFGSITTKTISELLEKESQVSVPAKRISGPFPIKSLGTYDIAVQLGQGVEFHMSVTVSQSDEE